MSALLPPGINDETSPFNPRTPDAPPIEPEPPVSEPKRSGSWPARRRSPRWLPAAAGGSAVLLIGGAVWGGLAWMHAKQHGYPLGSDKTVEEIAVTWPSHDPGYAPNQEIFGAMNNTMEYVMYDPTTGCGFSFTYDMHEVTFDEFESRIDAEASRHRHFGVGQISGRQDDFRMEVAESRRDDADSRSIPLEFAVYSVEYDGSGHRPPYTGASAVHVFGNPGRPFILDVRCPADTDAETVRSQLTAQLESVEIVLVPAKN